MMQSFVFFFQLLESTFRVSTPLIFAALAGLICERSGVINMSLEGFMLVGAFAGASTAFLTQSSFLGLFAAVFAGTLFAFVYGLFVIEFRAHQIVSGFAMNMLAQGMTPFLSKILFQSASSTPGLPLRLHFVTGLMWLAIAMVVLTSLWLYYTPFGLWVRFAGEHPEALDSAGVAVRKIRWLAVLLSGVLTGLGGASLSMALASSFSKNMTAGRGFMAIAALILGKWRPIPAALTCFLFGFTDAIQVKLQGVVLWGTEPIPIQFIQVLPCVVTLIVLAGWVGKSRPPQALGIPY